MARPSRYLRSSLPSASQKVQFTWYRSRLDAAAPVARKLSPLLLAWICCTSRDRSASDTSPGCRAILRVGADVDDPDAVVSVEHREAVARPNLDPVLEGAGRAVEEAHAARAAAARSRTPTATWSRDLDLALIVRVDLHQHFEPASRLRARRSCG